jgi:prepilin-type N-terminal cleavage/methylation domain-containing protein
LNFRKAFSITELSVVILILGILISGIVSSLDIYKDAKITSLRSLTINSITSRIPNIEFWSDTISKKSFDKSMQNNSLVSNWNNINPHILVKNSAISPSTAKTPKYIENGINNLPSILFDGVDDCLRIPFDLNYTINKEVSIFLVFNSQSVTANNTALFGLDDQGGWGRFVHSRFGGNDGGSSFGSNIGILQNISKLKTDFILTYVSNQGIANGSLLRLNKNYSSIIQTHNFTSQAGPEYFGLGVINGACSHSFSNTLFSEIIVYSRALNSKEILQIEEYLAKKYSIKLID